MRIMIGPNSEHGGWTLFAYDGGNNVTLFFNTAADADQFAEEHYASLQAALDEPEIE